MGLVYDVLMCMKFSSSFTVVMKKSSLQLPFHAGTLSIKSMLQSAPKHVIFILKIQKFPGEGAQPPSQIPSPAGGGYSLPHPPPALGACGASIFAPSAPHSDVWLRACVATYCR